MHLAHRPPTIVEARHQWQVTELWMRDANKNTHSKPMAKVMLSRYFHIVEEIMQTQQPLEVRPHRH